MPQIFKIGSYWIYFWVNENEPIDPIHVRIAEGKPVEKSTKVWITMSGKCIIANNLSHIPDKKLRVLIRVIEANSDEIINKWKSYFGEIRFFC